MNDEQIFFAIIAISAVFTVFIMLWIEYHYDKKNDTSSYERGYREGYDEASVRAYTFTRAFNSYQDWETFLKDMNSIDK